MRFSYHFSPERRNCNERKTQWNWPPNIQWILCKRLGLFIVRTRLKVKNNYFDDNNVLIGVVLWKDHLAYFTYWRILLWSRYFKTLNDGKDALYNDVLLKGHLKVSLSWVYLKIRWSFLQNTMKIKLNNVKNKFLLL